MGTDFHHCFLSIISGQRRGLIAGTWRFVLRLGEIPYASLVQARNTLFAHGLFKSHRLARPVISVGNITTGGTGKTPVVRWLADQLRDMHPAILMRGYKSAGGMSDEARFLQEQLPSIPVIANPDRRRAAAIALAKHHDVGLFILDDGFQHRQVARDFDLVLIDATSPFGYQHVLPRGLLRESLTGLARADAFLITRANQAESAELQYIEKILKQHNLKAPIYHADHALTEFCRGNETLTVESLQGKPLFLFCGIGNPASLRDQLIGLGLTITGQHFFADHHSYTTADLDRLLAEMSESHASLLVTTEKDWTKIAPLNHPAKDLICRAGLTISFHADDEQKLLERVRLSISPPAR
ncbi:MAG TPA: tetraacyldisaccharide 4'-kinase [Tepidisphaeraceae bacterium]|nr:tetraacyldisaccharide 4'-kinase [Tepidisphaeraceae bacterium]